MDDQIFLSYIIPCYNVQKYLPKCIESLSIQKIEGGHDIEFIFVNDGSTDNTMELLIAFEKKDKRVKIINQVNQGVSAARNNGLKLATGQYIFFLDGDDFLTDEASQLVYNEVSKKASDIIMPNANIVYEDDPKKEEDWNTFSRINPGVYTVQQFADKIIMLPISVKVYRRDILIKNHITFDIDLKVGEVYTFFLHALMFSEYVTLTHGKMMNYVQRNAGTTLGYNIERDRQIIKSIQRIDEYAGLCKFNIKDTFSYNHSLYVITSMFGTTKYSNIPYNREMLLFLKTLTNDKIYKKMLHYFVVEKPKFNSLTLKSIILYCFPIKFSLQLLKILRKITNRHQ